MKQAIAKLVEPIEGFLEWGGTKKDIGLLIISGITLIISIFDLVPLPFDIAWVAIVLCGIPIIMEAIIGLVTAFDIKADVLVAMALIAAVITGEIFAAGEVAFIMQLGALLENLTVAKARAGIEKLVNLTPTTARVIRNSEEIIVPAEDIKKGDIIRVLAGESIAVDGEIISGETSIDQSVVTGESMPIDKKVGDEVFSGTVNQFGTFEMVATKIGEDSSLQRMVKLVQSADASKAKIVGIADRWATWIVIAAVTTAIFTFIFTGEIIRAVTVLVVFCPCALVLATPTAIMAAIGNVTKYGFLVREGDALEKLATVKYITFDKTGTLTYGKPEVVNVTSFSEEISKEKLFSLVATAELRSEHPLGKSLVSSYRKAHGDVIQPQSFALLLGRGVTAQTENITIYAGNINLMNEQKITVNVNMIAQTKDFLDEGCTIIWIASEDKILGFIAMRDVIRNNAKDLMDETKALGITPILLTGDQAVAASHIAKQAGIEIFISGCLPEMKLTTIQSYQDKGFGVCMVGDGINDAPALKCSDVGIAMGGIGSDIAIEAADIALINDNILEIPHLIDISKKMMTIIKLNMVFSMTLNFVAIIFAVAGTLSPVVGALVHNAGSVVVILNSARILKWRRKNR